jgi:glycosyltransferase involved in cell wall biosynthesis
MSRPTVTLCMIVKDEEHIIHECLDSMAPYIDRYDITDTGSTDKTKEIIREWGKKNNIPGEVYDAPWQGFGKSRTQSLRNANKGGADYSWVIDADDMVEGNFEYPPDFGQHDGYALWINRGEFNWWRHQMFKNGIGWEYVGVIHEYANCAGKENASLGKISGNYHIEARTMGTRTLEFGDDQCAKYNKDAELLVDCLTNPDSENYEPDNHRYTFYAAQSYFDAQNFEKALEWYVKRAEQGGWEEEQWYSIYRIGICKCILGKDWTQAQDHFLQAWNLRPHRAEPLYQLARIHRENKNPRLGYLFAQQAVKIPYPHNDILFLSKDIYEWMCWDELASSAYYVGDMMAGLEACNKLLTEKRFPKEHEERIIGNFKHYSNWWNEKEEARVKAETEQAKLEVEDKIRRSELRKEKEAKAKINKRRGKKVKVR